MHLKLDQAVKNNKSPFSEEYTILLIEDDAENAARRSICGIDKGQKHITVNLHEIKGEKLDKLAGEKLFPEDCEPRSLTVSKIKLALDLIDRNFPQEQKLIVVAKSCYGCDPRFLQEIVEKKRDFLVELRPSFKVVPKRRGKREGKADLKELRLLDMLDIFHEQRWEYFSIFEPTSNQKIAYSCIDLEVVDYPKDFESRLFLAQRGAIPEIGRNSLFFLTSLEEDNVERLVTIVGWSRWIRPISRAKNRLEAKGSKSQSNNSKAIAELATRPNLANQNIHPPDTQSFNHKENQLLKGILKDNWKNLNIVELFAGAGGMGLGFLMANNGINPYKLIFSGEVNPICVKTLEQNHLFASKVYEKELGPSFPEQSFPIDLRLTESQKKISAIANELGGVQILIGGPPCQGFSSSNRNSGGINNPNNKLFTVFLDYVEQLRPAVFILENVQGVAWAQHQSGDQEDGLLGYLNGRMKKAGYFVSQKLLDAAWYGVPQYRYRFFALGIRNDLGYTPEDFGDWGPYPIPTHGLGTSQSFVTVRDAISDLPLIGNGYSETLTSYKNIKASNPFLDAMRYGADPDTVTDHITSRHADYVIKRYELIPQGGNWESIKHTMTNYADISRTHSNIYRRLVWNEPSITIGHYRKSMLIHPEQNRGLSWREAARLQSFPDWVRFAGNSNPIKWEKGIVHKQQQLANAVCPLLTKAVAEFILKI